MSQLIIHAHPVAESLNRALFAAATEGLTTPSGQTPNVASLTDGDDPTVDDLRGLRTLVFVYPTWWGGPPAIVLDWIQRRLGPWVDGSPSSGPPLGPSPIATVDTLVAITTHGSPQLINRITGEPGRQLFKRSIKRLASPTCSWHWLAYYGIDADDAVSREAFLAGIPAELRKITSG